MEIFNQQNHGRSTSWSAKGFKDLEEAESYAQSIRDQWGYSPSCQVIEEPEIIVQCRMYNSCD